MRAGKAPGEEGWYVISGSQHRKSCHAEMNSIECVVSKGRTQNQRKEFKRSKSIASQNQAPGLRVKENVSPPLVARWAMVGFSSASLRSFNSIKSSFLTRKGTQMFIGRILVLEATYTGHLAQSLPFTNRNRGPRQL